MKYSLPMTLVNGRARLTIEHPLSIGDEPLKPELCGAMIEEIGELNILSPSATTYTR